MKPITNQYKIICFLSVFFLSTSSARASLKADDGRALFSEIPMGALHRQLNVLPSS